MKMGHENDKGNEIGEIQSYLENIEETECVVLLTHCNLQ